MSHPWTKLSSSNEINGCKILLSSIQATHRKTFFITNNDNIQIHLQLQQELAGLNSCCSKQLPSDLRWLRPIRVFYLKQVFFKMKTQDHHFSFYINSQDGSFFRRQAAVLRDKERVGAGKRFRRTLKLAFKRHQPERSWVYYLALNHVRL